IAVQDGWLIEDGPFKGQNCFYIPNSTVGWIPQCDLIGLKSTSLVQWQEIGKSLGFINYSKRSSFVGSGYYGCKSPVIRSSLLIRR
ncbi:MAG: hypothetical protein QNL11_12235, partial [Desulfobacterales bacterium]|nr:hypothetical protein [Desulfobacterales bacterium]